MKIMLRRPAPTAASWRSALSQRRWLSADEYHGPGGLSARELFEKVQQSRAKEEGARAAREDGKNASARDGEQRPEQRRLLFFSDEELVKASSKDLRAMLLDKSVDVSDCFERADLVARARAHLL